MKIKLDPKIRYTYLSTVFNNSNDSQKDNSMSNRITDLVPNTIYTFDVVAEDDNDVIDSGSGSCTMTPRKSPNNLEENQSIFEISWNPMERSRIYHVYWRPDYTNFNKYIDSVESENIPNTPSELQNPSGGHFNKGLKKDDHNQFTTGFNPFGQTVFGLLLKFQVTGKSSVLWELTPEIGDRLEHQKTYQINETSIIQANLTGLKSNTTLLFVITCINQTNQEIV